MRNLLFIFLILIPLSVFSQKQDQLTINTTNVSFVVDTIYDYTGLVYKNGSSVYNLDSVRVGDVLTDISSNEYRIDSISRNVPNALMRVWVTCLDTPCIVVQTGNGYISKPTDNYNLIANPYNSSSTITEQQVADNLISNWSKIDNAINSLGLDTSTVVSIIRDSLFVERQELLDSLSAITESDPIYAADSASIAFLDDLRTNNTTDNYIPYYKSSTDSWEDSGISQNGSITELNNNFATNGNWISGDGGTEGLYITSTGEVNVGSTQSTYDLFVRGQAQFLNQASSGLMTVGATGSNFLEVNAPDNQGLSFSAESFSFTGEEDLSTSGNSLYLVRGDNTVGSASRAHFFISDALASVATRVGYGVFTGATPIFYIKSESTTMPFEFHTPDFRVLSNQAGAKMYVENDLTVDGTITNTGFTTDNTVSQLAGFDDITGEIVGVDKSYFDLQAITENGDTTNNKIIAQSFIAKDTGYQYLTLDPSNFIIKPKSSLGQYSFDLTSEDLNLGVLRMNMNENGQTIISSLSESTDRNITYNNFNRFVINDTTGANILNAQSGSRIQTTLPGFDFNSSGRVDFNVKTNGSSNNTIAINAFGGNNGSNYYNISTGDNSASINLDTRSSVRPLRFFSKGIETLSLNSDSEVIVFNNIGIGTTTPAYKLDVNGTGRFTGALTVEGSSVDDDGDIVTIDPITGLHGYTTQSSLLRTNNTTDNYIPYYKSSTDSWEDSHISATGGLVEIDTSLSVKNKTLWVTDDINGDWTVINGFLAVGKRSDASAKSNIRFYDNYINSQDSLPNSIWQIIAQSEDDVEFGGFNIFQTSTNSAVFQVRNDGRLRLKSYAGGVNDSLPTNTNKMLWMDANQIVNSTSIDSLKYILHNDLIIYGQLKTDSTDTSVDISDNFLVNDATHTRKIAANNVANSLSKHERRTETAVDADVNLSTYFTTQSWVREVTYTVGLTSSATEDVDVTLPTPSLALYGVRVNIIPFDDNGTYSVNITGDANKIWNNGLATTLTGNGPAQLECTADPLNSGQYIWTIIN